MRRREDDVRRDELRGTDIVAIRLTEEELAGPAQRDRIGIAGLSVGLTDILRRSARHCTARSGWRLRRGLRPAGRRFRDRGRQRLRIALPALCPLHRPLLTRRERDGVDALGRVGSRLRERPCAAEQDHAGGRKR